MVTIFASPMLRSHYHHRLFSTVSVPLSLTHHRHSSPSLHFLHTSTTATFSVSAIPPLASAWLTQLATVTDQFGPIELPFSSPSDLIHEPSTVQVASTVLFSGFLTLYFFRSIQRRAKRAKELKFRSSGVKKSMDTLKAMGATSIKAKSPPSPDQALLGSIIAGVIAVFLYRFTTSIEASLGHQTLSNNFSVRQITITIRTIISGLCYLATFIYGINSVGLLLYSGQLAMDTFGGGPSGKETEAKILEQPGLSNASVENLTNNNKLRSTKEDQSSNNSP